MALSRTAAGADHDSRWGDRIENALHAWASLREQSRDFLTPWEPLWPPGDLTRSAFRARLQQYKKDRKQGSAYPFLIFRTRDSTLVGGLTLTNVRRGVAQMGSLGYWMGVSFAGQGYMSAAVRALLHYAFSELGLHRIEAGCLENNIASIRLLEKTGVQYEGLARSYLCIAGEWRPHRLYAILATDLIG